MGNDEKGGFGRRIAHQALMPVVAAAASAAAGLVAKKGPDFLEKVVLPKLKETTSGAGGAAESLPSRAKSAVGSVGDLAGDLTDRAKGVVGKANGSNGGGRTPSLARRISPDELQDNIDERAKARAARRRAAGRR